MNSRRIVLGALASLVFASTVPASAQLPLQRLPITTSGTLAAVTVVGRGSVHVPADRMRVYVHLFTQRNQPSADVDNAGKTIAEIMRAHGMPDATWTLPLTGSIGMNTTMPTIVGTIAKPTRASVEAIIRQTVAAVPDSFGTVIQSAQIQSALLVDDCSAAQERAERLAVEDARHRAEGLARAAGIQLGAVVGITESFPTPTACLPAADVSVNQGPQQDAFGAVDVPIVVNATVSFAIL